MKPGNYKCTICDFEAPDFSGLRGHLWEVHQAVPLKAVNYVLVEPEEEKEEPFRLPF